MNLAWQWILDGVTTRKTCFIDVTVWGKRAEFVSKYFNKGSGIHVEGRLDLDTWEDKNGGGKRSRHRVTAEQVTFPVGGNKNNTSQSSSPQLAGVGAGGWNSQEEIDNIPF